MRHVLQLKKGKLPDPPIPLTKVLCLPEAIDSCKSRSRSLFLIDLC